MDMVIVAVMVNVYVKHHGVVPLALEKKCKMLTSSFAICVCIRLTIYYKFIELAGYLGACMDCGLKMSMKKPIYADFTCMDKVNIMKVC